MPARISAAGLIFYAKSAMIELISLNLSESNFVAARQEFTTHTGSGPA